MSQVTLPTNVVFDNPLSVAAPVANTNPEAVDATSAPVQLGGVGVTWTTETAAAGQTAQIVLSGQNTTLNLGTGAAYVQAIGGGAIIESIQLVNTITGAYVPDVGKTIVLGNPNVAYNGATINLNAAVTGNAANAGQVTIAQAAGGLIGQATSGQANAGFAYYALGGTGNDSMQGSYVNDFIRGGGGNDSINAFAGNDLVRGGYGSDSIRLGDGNDTLYYTPDQIGNGDKDVLQDFTAGQDTIAIVKNILYTINGNQITFTNAVGNTSTLTAQAGVSFQVIEPSTNPGIVFIG